MIGETVASGVGMIITMAVAATGACGVLGFVALHVLAADRQAMAAERAADAVTMAAEGLQGAGDPSRSTSSTTVPALSRVGAANALRVSQTSTP